jgi:hypothetical protein
MAKRSLMDSLRSMSLLGADGEPYSPPEQGSGLAVQQWGKNQAWNKRFADQTHYIQNMGKPGMGFLGPNNTSPSPFSKWNVMGQVLQGRNNAVEASGGRMKMNLMDAYNDGGERPDTRFEAEQTSSLTGGNTLMQDAQQKNRGALKALTDYLLRGGR